MYLNDGEVNSSRLLFPGDYGFASVGERLLIVKGMLLIYL